MLIRHDPHNELACQKRDELAPLLGDDLPADLCLVLGGDGFMLRTIHELGEHHTYLGVNCGRLGFLLNAMDETDSLLLRLRELSQWHILQAVSYTHLTLPTPFVRWHRARTRAGVGGGPDSWMR